MGVRDWSWIAEMTEQQIPFRNDSKKGKCSNNDKGKCNSNNKSECNSKSKNNRRSFDCATLRSG